MTNEDPEIIRVNERTSKNVATPTPVGQQITLQSKQSLSLLGLSVLDVCCSVNQVFVFSHAFFMSSLCSEVRERPHIGKRERRGFC